MAKLTGFTIAVLATDGFEQSELEKPVEALKNEGAIVEIVSIKKGKIVGWQGKNWGNEVEVTVDLDEASGKQYNGLVLPGGVINPDKLRLEEKAIAFIKKFVAENKPIAAICHGPWTLVNANALQGKTVTSWPSIKEDLKNAGATWVDKEVVKDGKLITSRKPDDLKAFNEEFIKLLSSNQ